MKPTHPMNAAQGFHIDLEALLAPVPGGDGAGASLRSDPIYQKIRDARYQDDATLPMREWERPLIKADWKTVASLSSEALRARSKDFQLAAWLCEAWTHLYQIDGFVAGTQLMTDLVERYWESAHPLLGEDDADARIAPFVWINGAIASVLSLHVPLMLVEGREPAAVNLGDWRLVVGGAAAKDPDGLTRELLDKHVTMSGNLAALLQLAARLDDALEAWSTLARLVDVRLGDDAPSLSQAAEVLAQLARAVKSLVGDRAPAPEPAFDEAGDAASGGLFQDDDAPADAQGAVGTSPQPSQAAGMTQMAAAGLMTGGIVDRAHAYRLLEEVADYLSRHEPHSPTPYLLMRAVSWGHMPLAELMREIVRQEGDLARYLALLGLD